MENQRESFIFYRSFFEAIEDLPDKNKLEIYKAIGEYSLDFKESKLTGISKTIFTLIKPQLDANNKRYTNGCKPKTKQTISKTEAKPKQDVSKQEANDNVNVNHNENVNVNVNDNIELVVPKVTTLETYIKKEFTSEFITDIYNKYKIPKQDFQEECELFVLYRKEKSINGKKEKWEKEKTFDPKLRFRTWMKNNDKWSKTVVVNNEEEERKIKLAEIEEKKKLLFNKI